MNITVGADPEFFVRKRAHYLPGHMFHVGTKQHPLKTENGHVQVDGIALECNVRPASTRDEFVHNIRSVMSDLSTIVQRTEPDAVLVNSPSIFFGRKRLSKLPLEYAMLGCTPDFNAYTMKMNPRPNHTLPIRTGAGHIHVGWTQNVNERDRLHMERCASLARQLDFYLGLPSLLWDDDDRRRQMYGKAGAFRPKSYGMEYRVLSNRWVETDELIGWVFDRTVAAFKHVTKGVPLERLYGSLAQEIIDDNIVDWDLKYTDLAEEVIV